MLSWRENERAARKGADAKVYTPKMRTWRRLVVAIASGVAGGLLFVWLVPDRGHSVATFLVWLVVWTPSFYWFGLRPTMGNEGQPKVNRPAPPRAEGSGDSRKPQSS
ncbi:hypothetical protein GCM10009541_18920 [Micromonospora gifhornensis]|uniref:Uncharacterized protein n=1 Tax=Micromonospora gifhornensis TaxID=84594 RepID=A0ABQ4IG23_9ACTN|nr:hypothetical protein Vgi01_35450 [Micromonospora gifhornensis]